MPIITCISRCKGPSNCATTWVHSVLQLQLCFLDTLMKVCHSLNIALHWHAHLTLGLPAMCDSRQAVLVFDMPVSRDMFAWRPLCFR